ARPPRATHGRLRSGGASERLDASTVVHSVCSHKVVDLVVRIDGLAGVAPESLEDVVLHRAALHECIVHIGDLELAASRRLERRDDFPHALVVEVDPRDCEVARWALRLFDDVYDSIPLESGNTEMAKMRGVADRREQDAGAAGLRLE